MPSLPSHRCIEPGCHNTTKGQRCTTHGGTRTGTASQRGYGAAWRAVRDMHLAFNPTCTVCGNLATVVDHISPRRLEAAAGRDADRPSNLQSLCASDHGRKTAGGQ